MRGIAALIVVFHHYFAAFLPYTMFGEKFTYIQHFEWELLFFYPPFGLIGAGQFAVCLFFILSGYVLSYSFLGEPNTKIKIISCIVKRPVRLGGIVIFSILMSAFLWSNNLYFNQTVADISSSTPWFKNFWSEELDISLLIKNVLLSPYQTGSYYNPPLWTIEIELYGSIYIYLFLLFFGDFKYRLLIALTLVIFNFDSLYQGFWLGIVLADFHKNYPNYFDHRFSPIFKKAFSVSLLLLFLFLTSYPNYVDSAFINKTIYLFLPDDSNFSGYPMISALLVFIFVNSNAYIQNHLQHKSLIFLGNISFSLYAIHLLVIGSISSSIFVYLQSSYSYGVALTLTFSSGLIIIIYASLVLTKIVDQTSINVSGLVGRLTYNALNLLRITLSNDNKDSDEQSS